MDKRIVKIEQEPNGWWLYLKPGYIHMDGTHAITEDTRREVLSRMGEVVPCDCDECQRLAAGKW